MGASEAVAHTATILPIPAGVWLAFKTNIDRRPVRVLYETPVIDLIQDPDSLEVFGAMVEHQGKRSAIKARRGVVVATGGYEADAQMQRDYCGYEPLYPLGTPGIAELQLTHYKEKVRGHWVDTPHIHVQPVHMIFDETTRTMNCLATKAFTWNIAAEGLDWSDDNAAEIANGTILKADSIAELAKRMGRDPAAVMATVDEYNKACAQGQDACHGRHPITLQPIAQPPYYAIRIVPAVVCTSGGARRNIESEVLTPAGATIPRAI
ncbi:MAG: FAD-binding protein [Rhodocyclaceae bacterium]|nr:FAD-binding protein [Rhodocyclaceae bacterium]